jgi:hypothetical protein
MRVYEGEVGIVGHGTWSDGGGGGKTVLSVLEIGNAQLKRIVLPDYLANYLTPGQKSRVLIGQGLSRGLLTRPFVAAVEVNGKKYKVDSILTMAVLKVILYSLLAFPLWAIAWPLGLLATAGVATYYIRDYLELKRF